MRRRRRIGAVMDPDDGRNGRRLRADDIRSYRWCADPQLIFRHGILFSHPGDLRVFQHDLGVGGIPLQGGQDGVVHCRKDGPLRAELDLGFGGVDVYIHRV